jgi:hypothetical protein
MILKILLWAAHLLFWIALAIMLFGSFCDRRSAKVLKNGRVEFSPNWAVVCAGMLVYLRMLHIAVDFLKHGTGKPWDFATGALLGVAVVASLFEFPGTIVITSESVAQIYWFRRNKRIRWEEIVEINSGVKDRLVTIRGKDETKIVHSRFLADRSRLLEELKTHCGENLPPDFPREPVEGL